MGQNSLSIHGTARVIVGEVRVGYSLCRMSQLLARQEEKIYLSRSNFFEERPGPDLYHLRPTLTTFGLGVRHTGPGRPAQSLSMWRSLRSTAPPQKFETLARPNATFSRFCIQPPIFHLPTMAPRTILSIINSNRGIRNKLFPNQRGKIKDTRLTGTIFKIASEIGEYALLTIKIIIRRAPERHDRISI
jgi:hypothetical protein